MCINRYFIKTKTKKKLKKLIQNFFSKKKRNQQNWGEKKQTRRRRRRQRLEKWPQKKKSKGPKVRNMSIWVYMSKSNKKSAYCFFSYNLLKLWRLIFGKLRKKTPGTTNFLSPFSSQTNSHSNHFLPTFHSN